LPRVKPDRQSDPTDRYAMVSSYFDEFVDEADRWEPKTDGYHGLIGSIYRALVPNGATVLEIGSGRGDLLASLEPSRGVGIDVSARMVEAARARHPGLEFIHGEGESLDLAETFDYVILSDLVPYVHDLQALVAAIVAHSHAGTRVVANTYSNLWRGPLSLMRILGMRPSRPTRNWVAPRDLSGMFELGGLEVIGRRNEILLPVRGGLVSRFVNGLLARLPVLRSLTLTYWLIARPAPQPKSESGVSVVVPCRNEAGMIETIVERVPEMGLGTEIVFVENGSSDGTKEEIERVAGQSERDLKLVVMSEPGKAKAVHAGFEAARHNMLMVLDADLTVVPEDLPKFYEALASGRGEMVNGSRLVYEMDPAAMRFLNLLGNKAFATLMSAILGQYIKDTLCGTKAFFREDYERLMSRRHEVEGEDPYGDFDFLLGASLAQLKILDLPIRYAARTYGDSKMERFPVGGQLARLAAAGFRRIWVEPVDR
jgi:SAM-dependent methyltransferase